MYLLEGSVVVHKQLLHLSNSTNDDTQCSIHQIDKSLLFLHTDQYHSLV